MSQIVNPAPAGGRRKPRRGLAAAGLAAALSVAVPLIMSWEGDVRVGYLDVVRVPTACWGHTGAGVVVGRRYTGAECRAFLEGDVRRHADGIARCIAVDVPPRSLAAFVSFSFNVGVDGFCRSRVRRDLNAGQLRRACDDLSAYVFAGRPPRRVRGLVNRRADERRLCLSGASQ